MKKFAGDSTFYTCVPKITVIWCSYWDMEWDWKNFFSFGSFFALSAPWSTQELKILKLKKTSGDIIILHICIINDNHMMYVSWDMECDRQNFLSFWTIYCPFTNPPKNLKNQNFEKTKQTPGDITILHKCNKNHDHMVHCSWDTMYEGCNSYFFFWAILPSNSLLTQKTKI